VASRRAKCDGDFRVPTHNNDMEVWPEEGGKLENARLQSTLLPVRAKTRRQTITPDGTLRLLCQSSYGRRQTGIFFKVSGGYRELLRLRPLAGS
jgi:hypothetical protein